MILAIDPGNIESALVLMTEFYIPLAIIKCKNEEVFLKHTLLNSDITDVVIERIASYGMSVGQEIFDTCVWCGRFQQYFETMGFNVTHIFRRDVKLNLCGQVRAKDPNVRQALIDRFGIVGTKKQQGWFYGFHDDIWAAYAVGVTFLDNKK